MSTQPSTTETALKDLNAAVQVHLAGFMQSLPLQDSDLAQIRQALLNAPDTRDKLALIQDTYLRRWVSILQDGERPDETVAPDPRFSSPQWKELPWFRLIHALYDLNSQFITELAGLPDLPAPVRHRLEFFGRQLVDAMSPANFAVTNPDAIAKALSTGGDSLAQGARMLSSDLSRGRISMSDETRFEVGRNLAVTPGEVVFENELIQLIQYRPRTGQVHSRPLLIVPPFINKYYILDLQAHNSFAAFCVDQGLTTYMISWRNVPGALGHLNWDDYIARGVFDAVEAVKDISQAKSINALGYCVGGTLLATALAVMAARNDESINCLTLLASMLDFSDVGEISAYVNEDYVSACERQYSDGGVVPGATLTNAFASLRANELVWNYVVSKYLMGDVPRAFDLLFWNSDSANLAGPLYAYYLRNMYLENRLKVPDALRMQGYPVDLRKIVVEAMVVAARDDHIVPWRTAYHSARILGGETRFVLAASGHVAGMINSPAAKRRSFWTSTADVLPEDPENWLGDAGQTQGSWWPHWVDWLRPRAGEKVAAPLNAGNQRYKPIEAAPGRFVRERPD